MQKLSIKKLFDPKLLKIIDFEVKFYGLRYDKSWVEMKFCGLKRVVIMRFLEY